MEIISRLVDLTTKGERFCLATIIVSDDPDIPVGRKMIVFPDGTTEGSVGSTQVDKDLRPLALEALTEKKTYSAVVKNTLRAFLDILSEDVHLLICGAGHIAMPLARFAREVGFSITVLDDRSDFAHPSRFPGCEIMAGNFSASLRDMPLGLSTYVVIITRGHEHDVECLTEILQKETAYTGLIGSHRRVRFVLEMLDKKGLSHKRLNEVFTPIGLPIGSESPEEIALSIVAELVCVRRKGARQTQALRVVSGGER